MSGLQNGAPLYRDLGSQYTSQVLKKYLSSKGILHSFSLMTMPVEQPLCTASSWYKRKKCTMLLVI